MRHVGEQLGAQPVGLLERVHLLLGARQPHRHRGRLGLLPVETLEVAVGAAQLLGERLGAELGGTPARPEAADQAGRAEEHQQVDDVGLVGDRQGVERGNEEPVDEQEARAGGDERGNKTGRDAEPGDNRDVDEDVVARRPDAEWQETERDGGGASSAAA